MYEWQQLIQRTVDQIDASLRAHDDEAVVLRRLSETLGYSEYYMTRKFREISGMRLRDYLRRRRLAFALKEAAVPFWTLRWTTAFPHTKPLPAPLSRFTA